MSIPSAEADVVVQEPWTPRRAFKTTLMVGFVVAMFFLVFYFRHVLLLMFLAIVLATALKPIVTWLNEHGLHWSFAVLATFIVPGLAMLTAAIIWMPLLLNEASDLMAGIPERYGKLRGDMLKSPTWAVEQTARLMPSSKQIFSDEKGKQSAWSNLWQFASRVTTTAFRLSIASIVVCLLAVYWLMQEQRTVQSLFMAVQPERREEVQLLVTQIEDKVGAYVRGQLVLCLCVFVLSLIGYWLVGLPGAFLLALLAGVFEAIPMLGPILAAIPPLIVAASEDPQKLIWVLLVSIIIQQLENYLLVPRIMDNAVGVNAIMTLLGMVAFGTLFGPLGAVLAIPLSAIVQLVVERYVLSRKALEPPKPTGRDEVHRLRYQTQELVRDIRLMVRHGDEASDTKTDNLGESIEAIAVDLDAYLAVVAGDAPQPESTERVLAT